MQYIEFTSSAKQGGKEEKKKKDSNVKRMLLHGLIAGIKDK